MRVLALLAFGLFVLNVQATDIVFGSVEANVQQAIQDIISLEDPSAYKNLHQIDYAKLVGGFHKCDSQSCHSIEPADMPNANDTRSNYVWSQHDRSYYYCDGGPGSIENTVCARIEDENLPYADYIGRSTPGWAKCQYGLIHSSEADPGKEFLDCQTMTLEDQLRYITKKSDAQSGVFRHNNETSLYCPGADVSSCRELKIDEVSISRENWIPSWANSVTHMSGYCDDPSTYLFKPGQRCNIWIKMPEVPYPFKTSHPPLPNTTFPAENTSSVGSSHLNVSSASDPSQILSSNSTILVSPLQVTATPILNVSSIPQPGYSVAMALTTKDSTSSVFTTRVGDGTSTHLLSFSTEVVTTRDQSSSMSDASTTVFDIPGLPTMSPDSPRPVGNFSSGSSGNFSSDMDSQSTGSETPLFLPPITGCYKCSVDDEPSADKKYPGEKFEAFPETELANLYDTYTQAAGSHVEDYPPQISDPFSKEKRDLNYVDAVAVNTGLSPVGLREATKVLARGGSRSDAEDVADKFGVPDVLELKDVLDAVIYWRSIQTMRQSFPQKLKIHDLIQELDKSEALRLQAVERALEAGVPPAAIDAAEGSIDVGYSAEDALAHALGAVDPSAIRNITRASIILGSAMDNEFIEDDAAAGSNSTSGEPVDDGRPLNDDNAQAGPASNPAGNNLVPRGTDASNPGSDNPISDLNNDASSAYDEQSVYGTPGEWPSVDTGSDDGLWMSGANGNDYEDTSTSGHYDPETNDHVYDVSAVDTGSDDGPGMSGANGSGNEDTGTYYAPELNDFLYDVSSIEAQVLGGDAAVEALNNVVETAEATQLRNRQLKRDIQMSFLKSFNELYKKEKAQGIGKGRVNDFLKALQETRPFSENSLIDERIFECTCPDREPREKEKCTCPDQESRMEKKSRFRQLRNTLLRHAEDSEPLNPDDPILTQKPWKDRAYSIQPKPYPDGRDPSFIDPKDGKWKVVYYYDQQGVKRYPYVRKKEEVGDNIDIFRISRPHKVVDKDGNEKWWAWKKPEKSYSGRPDGFTWRSKKIWITSEEAEWINRTKTHAVHFWLGRFFGCAALVAIAAPFLWGFIALLSRHRYKEHDGGSTRDRHPKADVHVAAHKAAETHSPKHGLKAERDFYDMSNEIAEAKTIIPRASTVTMLPSPTGTDPVSTSQSLKEKLLAPDPEMARLRETLVEAEIVFQQFPDLDLEATFISELVGSSNITSNGTLVLPPFPTGTGIAPFPFNRTTSSLPGNGTAFPTNTFNSTFPMYKTYNNTISSLTTNSSTNLTLPLLAFPNNTNISNSSLNSSSPSQHYPAGSNTTKSSIFLNSLLSTSMLNSALTAAPSRAWGYLNLNATGGSFGQETAPSWRTSTLRSVESGR